MIADVDSPFLPTICAIKERIYLTFLWYVTHLNQAAMIIDLVRVGIGKCIISKRKADGVVVKPNTNYLHINH